MDFTRAVTFRTVDLNDAAPGLGALGLVGRSIDYCDLSPVTVDQYMDKKSQTDGMDFQGIGNLSLGARTFSMRGMLYGTTRTQLWTALTALETLLDPVQCYREDQANEGFLPLAFSAPTGAAGAATPLYVLARPVKGLHYVVNRDAHGTGAKIAAQADSVPLGIAWDCDWVQRDPRIYGALHTVAFTGSTSGTWVNAGDYPTLVDIVLVTNGSAGTVRFQFNKAALVPPWPAWAYDLTLTIPAGTNPRTIRYRGRTKLLTVVDTAVHATNEILRQDILSFATPNSDRQHPLIHAGANTYTVTVSGVGLLAGSQLTFVDAWA